MRRKSVKAVMSLAMIAIVAACAGKMPELEVEALDKSLQFVCVDDENKLVLMQGDGTIGALIVAVCAIINLIKAIHAADEVISVWLDPSEQTFDPYRFWLSRDNYL